MSEEVVQEDVDAKAGYRIVKEELGDMIVEVQLKGGPVLFGCLSDRSRSKYRKDPLKKDLAEDEQQILYFWYCAQEAGYEGTFDEFWARTNARTIEHCYKADMLMQGLDPNLLDRKREAIMAELETPSTDGVPPSPAGD